MEKVRIIAAMAAAVVVIGACTVQRKTAALRTGNVSASLVLPKEEGLPELSIQGAQVRDTIEVQDMDGRKVLIMKAIKDENGEMVATDVLNPAYVTARFRNLAERQGRVDLRFQIVVPESMQDSKWQLRFTPRLLAMGDSTELEPVVITGKDYRKAQLRGYQQYEKFLRSIITDSLKFISQRQLEVFLQRNIPQVFMFRDDTSYVSDEEFASAFGVTQRQAVDHYTKTLLLRRNEMRKSRTQKMFDKYVKVPIVTEGLRLDTVIRSANGDFVYEYVQGIVTKPQMKKVGIVLTGDVFEQERRIYNVPRSSPLTFYISSLSSFADGTERYLTKVTERTVEANTACYIDFRSGSSEIERGMGNNRTEIGRIESNLRSLVENTEFGLDSIVVTASCSPEGAYDYNRRLSQRRSESVSGFFGKYLKSVRDSLSREKGMLIDLDGSLPEEPVTPIRFISRNDPENWRMLDALVGSDTVLTSAERDAYHSYSSISDVDSRERRLQQEPFYHYLRESLYPRLRTVRFAFHLHRKGMIKDTIHTTVLDSTYMRGVQALKDMDYKTAVTLLRPYRDYNTAVACCAMDYNASAMDILKDLEPTGPVEYMLAILYSRSGDSAQAVQHYMNACGIDRSYVHRGNLDPEISSLIKTYGLNKED